MQHAILVRHGETDYSARGLATGRVDVPCPLSERGVAQARALAHELAGEQIELTVTSQLERTRETADIALAGRQIPRMVLPELNDPLYGVYEGGPLAAYLAWALASDSGLEPPGGGERRQAIAARYAAGFARILERPERLILVVMHALPIAYLLMAIAGRDPAPRVPAVEYAKTYRITDDELGRAVSRLEAWCAAPTW